MIEKSEIIYVDIQFVATESFTCAAWLPSSLLTGITGRRNSTQKDTDVDILLHGGMYYGN